MGPWAMAVTLTASETERLFRRERGQETLDACPGTRDLAVFMLSPRPLDLEPCESGECGESQGALLSPLF